MRLNRVSGAAFLFAFFSAVTTSAFAFDTGPHFDITEDVLRSEGFSTTSIRMAQTANYLVDFYEFMGKPKPRKYLDANCAVMLDDILKSGDAQHFDDLGSTMEVAHKWDTMLEATMRVVKAKTGAQPHVLGLLALLGMSLHNVQDFYAHSNWAEGSPNGPSFGQGSLAKYGTNPTWLSLDRADREALDIYTDLNRPSVRRSHGSWDDTTWTALNKDWPGRPHYADAYKCAYFASRQWVRLFQTWVNDPKIWSQMQQWNKATFDPDRDWDYARKISFYGGHWYGNGGIDDPHPFSSRTAATSPDFLLPTVLGYLGGRCISKNPSALRREVESLLLSWGTSQYRGPVNVTLPSPAPDNVRFVQLKVHQIAPIGGGDGFLGGQMDWYSRAMIAGQPYLSGLIDEHDTFDFDRKPYAPWTMTKAVGPATSDIPLYLQLMELDPKYVDQMDINPRPGLRTVVMRYSLATSQISGDLTGRGGANLNIEGNGDGDRARIHLSVSHIAGTCLR